MIAKYFTVLSDFDKNVPERVYSQMQQFDVKLPVSRRVPW